jgi:hypothetical protein
MPAEGLLVDVRLHMHPVFNPYVARRSTPSSPEWRTEREADMAEQVEEVEGKRVDLNKFESGVRC